MSGYAPKTAVGCNLHVTVCVGGDPPMKHVKPKSRPRPMLADSKADRIQDPCGGLEGKALCKCEKKAYKGGVVY